MWQMQPFILEWKFMDMIHMFLLIRHGDCRAIFITRKQQMKFIKSVIILQFMCLHWKIQRYDQQRRYQSYEKGVVILNFARDVLVNQEDIVDALVSEKVRCYVTDFPTKEIVGVRGAIVIPHLGASTEESEDNCAKMAAAEVKDFLENGNITHSVNFPDCDMGAKGEGERITILHKNIPNMIGQFTALLAEKNMNIEVMTNKSRKEYAYTMLDVDGTVSEDVEAQLAAVEGVLKVRVIR